MGKVDNVLQYAIGDPLRYLANWGRLYSLWPVHLETACCVPPDTVILGDNKPISEYSVGNAVIGSTGHVGVTRTFTRRFEGDVVQIRGRGMLPLVVTPEHPILVMERVMNGGKGTYTGRTTWKEAGDLTPAPRVRDGDRYLYPSGAHDCLVLPRVKGFVDAKEVELEEFANPRGLNIVRGRGENPPLSLPLNADTAWLLGLYTAEGWTTKNHDVYLAFGHDEEDLVGRTSGLARSLGYSPQVKVRETTTVVRFSSSILARALRAWCGHLALNKRIPDFILYHQDLTLLKSFIEGYLAGDGSKSTDPRGPRYDRASTVSRVLALQLQVAYARMGQFARLSMSHSRGPSLIAGRFVQTHDAYSMTVITSERKCADVMIGEDSITVPIREISRLPYAGPVHNLETTDSTYLASNAVVHNCSVEVGAAAGSRFDFERFGTLEAFGSLRQCDLLIVMGTVTRKLAPRLKLIYDQMAEPKWTIAMGACAITGGLYFDSYNVLRGIDDIIPVDVYVPGCPPRAEALLQGLVLLQEKIRKLPTLSGA